MEHKETRPVGYMFDFATDLGQGRSFVVRGNFPVGALVGEMNTEVDKIRAVADRQLAKALVVLKRDEVRNATVQRDTTASDLERFNAEKGGMKLTSQEVANRGTMETNLRKWTSIIQDLKEQLEAYEIQAA